jgi:hypothetical protein
MNETTVAVIELFQIFFAFLFLQMSQAKVIFQSVIQSTGEAMPD